jgi:hypothetical protein
MPFGQNPGLGGQHWGHLPQPSNSWGANNGAFGANNHFGFGMTPMNRPPGVPHQARPLVLRQALCNACKQLTGHNRGEGDDYHDVNTLIRTIMSMNPMLDGPPTIEEIEDLCGTEGNTQNGGGELQVRHNETDGSRSVKWTADVATPVQAHRGSGLGEIGSPMPSKTSPVAGLGPPGMSRAPGGFQSLGAVGSSNP